MLLSSQLFYLPDVFHIKKQAISLYFPCRNKTSTLSDACFMHIELFKAVL